MKTISRFSFIGFGLIAFMVAPLPWQLDVAIAQVPNTTQMLDSGFNLPGPSPTNPMAPVSLITK